MIYIKVDGMSYELREADAKQARIAYVEYAPTCESCDCELLEPDACISADSRGSVVVCQCGEHYTIRVNGGRLTDGSAYFKIAVFDDTEEA